MAYCNWENSSAINQRYHDEEWGVPSHDDRRQFEHLSMEVMQCGLSWDLIIRRRDVLRRCFDNFDFEKIAMYDEADIQRIMATEGMIRSRRKIEAIVNNAQRFLEIRREFGSFCSYIWGYSDGKTILYNKHAEGYIPASNGLSAAISKNLKARGFKFLGPVVIYSHLQSSGIINDHDKNRPCYSAINAAHPTVFKRRYLEKDVHFYGEGFKTT